MNIHTIYMFLGKRFRQKRMRRFLQTIQPSPDRHVMLDVGGYPEQWTSFEPCAKTLDILNLRESMFDPSKLPAYNIRTIVGNGCNLPFEDETYHIVYSNSVIEHLGSWESQIQFSKEVRRVGKSIWIQTPAKEFFIEPHYLTPFIHWLPANFRKKLLRNFTLWGWITRPSREIIEKSINEIRLLTKRDMEILFPDCEILEEKVLYFFTKSYIACRNKP